MAVPSECVTEFQTTVCNHCERAIPTPNFDLHHVHCSRNLEKCGICGDMVPKKHAQEHYMNTHAPVACSLCSAGIEREFLALHKGEECPRRIVTCEYCEFPLAAVDLYKHQEVCGNRTEYCDLCNKYVRLRERNNHEIQFHSISDVTAESSRDRSLSEGEQGAHRGQARGLSQKHIIFSIVITGVAFLIGSFYLGRRSESQHQ